MMRATRLPNGNLLVPSTAIVNGRVMAGMKEVKPGSADYAEWISTVKGQGENKPLEKLPYPVRPMARTNS